MSDVRLTLMTSHVGDLDSGVAADWAALRPVRSLVSHLLRQRAVAAMATQVPPTAGFGAEPHRGLGGKTINVTLVWVSNAVLGSITVY